MREVGVEELLGTSKDPFVRHSVDPGATRRAWLSASGAAAVVESTWSRLGEVPAGPVLTCLGPAAELDPLVEEVGRAVAPPWRLTVELESYPAVPPAWRHATQHRWHWMLTRETPPPPGFPVEQCRDAAEIDAVLDEANPGSFARPASTGLECWLGVRCGDRLVAVGALARQGNGTGHLRGVSVLPAYAGRGLGRAVSAGLTRRALADGSGVATLGVYTDNAPALAIYRGLGYEVVHTFASGPVGPPAAASQSGSQWVSQ